MAFFYCLDRVLVAIYYMTQEDHESPINVLTGSLKIILYYIYMNKKMNKNNSDTTMGKLY